jgi:hypothetical protein
MQPDMFAMTCGPDQDKRRIIMSMSGKTHWQRVYDEKEKDNGHQHLGCSRGSGIEFPIGWPVVFAAVIPEAMEQRNGPQRRR